MLNNDVFAINNSSEYMNKNIDMRSFYNETLKKNKSYEYSRWFSSSEKKAAFLMTYKQIVKYFFPYLNNKSKLLEVGAGPGVWTKFFLDKFTKMSVNIVDVSDEMLKQARTALSKHENVTYTRKNFEEFPLKKEYDLFFSSRAIEYMQDVDVVVKNISDSLITGGIGCIITKYPHYIRSKIFRRKIDDIHKLQISPHKLVRALKNNKCIVKYKVPVTFVFPFINSTMLNLFIYNIFSWLPLIFVQPFCESYMVVFVKK